MKTSSWLCSSTMATAVWRTALVVVWRTAYAQRSIMMRTTLIYTCAEFERELAQRKAFPWPDWAAAAHGLINGIVALMQGPIGGLNRV